MKAASSAPASIQPRSTTSMPTAPRRRSATRSSSAPWSAFSAMPPARISMSSTKSCDRPSARRGRRGRGDLFGPGHPRPGRAADPQSRQSIRRDADRPRAAPGAQARNRRGAFEFVRIWRDQRFAGLPPRRRRVECRCAACSQAVQSFATILGFNSEGNEKRGWADFRKSAICDRRVSGAAPRTS